MWNPPKTTNILFISVWKVTGGFYQTGCLNNNNPFTNWLKRPILNTDYLFSMSTKSKELSYILNFSTCIFLQLLKPKHSICISTFMGTSFCSFEKDKCFIVWELIFGVLFFALDCLLWEYSKALYIFLTFKKLLLLLYSKKHNFKI